MKKREVKSYEYILEEEEARLILKTLKYIRHRLNCHQENGAKHFIDIDTVNSLISDLEN